MKKITLLLTMLSALSISACDKSNDQAAVEAPAQAVEAKDASIENAAGLVENATTPATDDAATEVATTEAVPAEVAAPATEEKK